MKHFDCFKKYKLTSRSIFSAATASKFLAAKYKKKSVLLLELVFGARN